MELIINDLYVNISENNIHLHDSYKINTTKEKKFILNEILEADNRVLQYRSFNSIIHEWKAHNVLYKLNFKRDRTQHSDIEFKQKLRFKILYFLISLIDFIE